MKIPDAIRILAAIATLALLAGCKTPPPSDVGAQVEMVDNVNLGQPTQAPPENQKDVIPACPGSPTVWYFIPGHWAWRGNWVWVQGHWRTRPHPGDIWLPGKWVERGSVYVWEKGHWRSGAPADEESDEEK